MKDKRLNDISTCILIYGLVWDTKPGFARVNIDEEDDEGDDGTPIPFTTDWVPVASARTKGDTETWPLEIGEQVLCLFDQYLDKGIIISSVYNQVDMPDADAAVGKWRKRFDDGTFIEYDKNAHKLTASVQGDVNVVATGNVNVQANNIYIGGQDHPAAFADVVKDKMSDLIDKIIALPITVTGAAGTVSTTAQAELTTLKGELSEILSTKVKVG